MTHYVTSLQNSVLGEKVVKKLIRVSIDFYALYGTLDYLEPIKKGFGVATDSTKFSSMILSRSRSEISRILTYKFYFTLLFDISNFVRIINIEQ